MFLLTQSCYAAQADLPPPASASQALGLGGGLHPRQAQTTAFRTGEGVTTFNLSTNTSSELENQADLPRFCT